MTKNVLGGCHVAIQPKVAATNTYVPNQRQENRQKCMNRYTS